MKQPIMEAVAEAFLWGYVYGKDLMHYSTGLFVYAVNLLTVFRLPNTSCAQIFCLLFSCLRFLLLTIYSSLSWLAFCPF